MAATQPTLPAAAEGVEGALTKLLRKKGRLKVPKACKKLAKRLGKDASAVRLAVDQLLQRRGGPVTLDGGELVLAAQPAQQAQLASQQQQQPQQRQPEQQQPAQQRRQAQQAQPQAQQVQHAQQPQAQQRPTQPQAQQQAGGTTTKGKAKRKRSNADKDHGGDEQEEQQQQNGAAAEQEQQKSKKARKKARQESHQHQQQQQQQPQPQRQQQQSQLQQQQQQQQQQEQQQQDAGEAESSDWEEEADERRRRERRASGAAAGPSAQRRTGRGARARQPSPEPSPEPSGSGSGSPASGGGGGGEVEVDEGDGTWRDNYGRTDLKHGRFSAEEKKVLERAVADYARRHGHSTSDHAWLLQPRGGGRTPKGERGAVSDIAAALPNRTRKAVFAALQRMYSAGNKKGPWTAQEDARLRQLVRSKGQKWKEVGAAVGRTGEQCRDRWRKISLGDARNTGRWSEEERQRLEDLVMAYLDLSGSGGGRAGGGARRTIKTGDRADGRQVLDNVDWDLIASQLGTRNGAQCMEQWYSRGPSMVARGEWQPREDKLLVRALLEGGAQEERDAAWARAVPGRSEAQSQKRWRLMLKAMPAECRGSFRSALLEAARRIWGDRVGGAGAGGEAGGEAGGHAGA